MVDSNASPKREQDVGLPRLARTRRARWSTQPTRTCSRRTKQCSVRAALLSPIRMRQHPEVSSPRS
jgi:hypothetical protein